MTLYFHVHQGSDTQICNDVLLDTPDCCEDPQVGFTFKFYFLKLFDLL